MTSKTNKIICVMDGDCALCSFSARLIARTDSRDQVRIVTVQSPKGAALLQKVGLDANDPASWLVLDEGTFYQDAEAILHLAKALGGVWIIARLLGFLPQTIRGKLYHTIARNRYTWFGRTKMCALPDPKLQAKILE